MSNNEQKFLDALDKKLWTAADKRRSTLDAVQYKHAVLGIVGYLYRKHKDQSNPEVAAIIYYGDYPGV